MLVRLAQFQRALVCGAASLRGRGSLGVGRGADDSRTDDGLIFELLLDIFYGLILNFSLLHNGGIIFSFDPNRLIFQNFSLHWDVHSSYNSLIFPIRTLHRMQFQSGRDSIYSRLPNFRDVHCPIFIMKILIINGYGKSVSGLRSFEQYRTIIRDLLLGKREMIDTEIEFFIRDRDSIDELLYEIDSQFVRLECGKMFDSIDIVFFEGDANLRPWSPNAYKFLILLRMCLRSNKVLFASSFAMQGLVFLIASNIEQNMNVINGLNGGQLGDLSKIKKQLQDIRQSDYFLDNVTGDLYGFNYDTGEWVGKGNAGMHYRRAAEEFKTIGKYIMKAPQYKVQRMKELDDLYVSENEVICSLRKNQMHCHLFQSIPFEFVVPSKNSWDVHPFNFVNPKKTFQTMADAPKGPQIIMVTDNIVGTQFAIRKKYKETVEIMKNFMGHQLTKLCSGKASSIPIDLASIKHNDNAMDIYLEHMAQSKYGKNQKTIKFNVITEFHHAGFAAKKSGGLDVVMNNAIGTRKFKQTVQKLNPKDLTKLLEMNDFSGTNAEVPPSSHHSNPQKQPTPVPTHVPPLEELIPKEPFNKTGSEIRMLLHPSIDKQLMSEGKHLWVPGFMSQTRNRSSLEGVKNNRLKYQTEEFQLDRFTTGSKRTGTPGRSMNMEGTGRSPGVQHGFRTVTKDRWISDRDFKV